MSTKCHGGIPIEHHEVTNKLRYHRGAGTSYLVIELMTTPMVSYSEGYNPSYGLNKVGDPLLSAGQCFLKCPETLHWKLVRAFDT
jgi:hypothetical protein